MNFADFWKAWRHPKNRGSKAEAEQLFNALSLGQRIAMEAGMAPYFAYCDETEWYQPMQARRWLNKKKENWQSWAEAEAGEDADISQIQRETAEIKARNERRQAAAVEQWRDRYERQFGHRPS